MLLDPNNLFGINVDIFFFDVGYLDQNAHMILPVVSVFTFVLGSAVTLLAFRGSRSAVA
jgi:hypothetical protein